MHGIVFHIAIAWMAVLGIVLVFLVARARSILGRVLALDTLILLLVAALVLVGVEQRVTWYLDAALVLALLSFVGTVAAARYFATRGLFS